MTNKKTEGLSPFMFSPARVPEAEKDIDLQIQAVEVRIDKLVKGIEINNIPLLFHILQLSHDREELDRLGKALERVAPLVEQMDDLKRRKGLFELVTKDPGWIQWAFGDFSTELDQFVSTLVEEPESPC